MHYRYPPSRIFAGVAGGGGAIALAGLQSDWLLLVGWWPFAIIGGVLALSGGYWIWDAFAEERHLHTMAKFASVNKWEFSIGTPAYLHASRALHSFPVDQGVNQRDTACISGTYNGRRCSSFTHEYEIGTGDEKRHTERWQITVVELEYPLKTVDILPDDVLAKFAKSLGGQDIDFESADFNRKWRVMARDLKYAHDIVHPRMIERLLRPDADGLAIRVEGRAVMCWRWERRGPADLARRLGVLTSIAKLIPEFVLREFEYEQKKIEEAARKREEDAPDWANTPYALTSGRYTGIGAEDYPDVATDGEKAKPAPRDDEDREW
ncbi:MAG: DUF3137 domain-containing protein [Demequinaceae bacterium]|nr:DUF3137 domain-containing protein [Demequinaceae bacterium]